MLRVLIILMISAVTYSTFGQKAVVVGDSTLQSNDSILVNQSNHLVAAIGVSDLIVVHTPSATLVCPRRRAGSIKPILGRLR